MTIFEAIERLGALGRIYGNLPLIVDGKEVELLIHHKPSVWTNEDGEQLDGAQHPTITIEHKSILSANLS